MQRPAQSNGIYGVLKMHKLGRLIFLVILLFIGSWLLVESDGNAGFLLHSVGGAWAQITNLLNLPATSDTSHGVISIDSIPFMHAFPSPSINGPAGDTNTFLGFNAGSFNNHGGAYNPSEHDTGIGGYALNSVGGDNNSFQTSDDVAVGWHALMNCADDCEENTAIGTWAMEANGTGIVADGVNVAGNVAVGFGAMQAGTRLNANTAVGWDAAQNLNGTVTGGVVVDGISNVALGYTALNASVHGKENTVVGAGALNIGLTPVDAVAIGYHVAPNFNTTALVAIGYQAATALTSGPNNTVVGGAAFLSDTTGG
jgi:hypothetical protein